MVSFLWNRKSKEELIRYEPEKPSPMHLKNSAGQAQGSESDLDGSGNIPSVNFCLIERTSPSASPSVKKDVVGKEIRKRGLQCQASAGMTVEASIVLPLFLFFFLNLGCVLEMIRLQGNLQLALWQTGRELSVYGYVLDSGELPGEDGEDAWWKGMGAGAFSAVYIKNRLTGLAGKEYLDSSPLVGGAGGLKVWERGIWEDEDVLDITIACPVAPWSTLAGFPFFAVACRYYTHIWNGYRLAGDEDSEAKRTVYVTSDSAVYHLFRDCTHLQLSVRAVSGEETDRARNRDGRKYRPCEKCTGGRRRAVLYIAEDGECYHCDRQCSGLKRRIYITRMEETSGMRLCSRCSQRVGQWEM